MRNLNRQNRRWARRGFLPVVCSSAWASLLWSRGHLRPGPNFLTPRSFSGGVSLTNSRDTFTSKWIFNISTLLQPHTTARCTTAMAQSVIARGYLRIDVTRFNCIRCKADLRDSQEYRLIYIYIYIYIYICILYIYVYVYIYMYMYMYMCVYICMYVCMYVRICQVPASFTVVLITRVGRCVGD